MRLRSSPSPFPNSFPSLGQGEKSLSYRLGMLAKKLIFRSRFGKRFILQHDCGLTPTQLFVAMEAIVRQGGEGGPVNLVEVGIARANSTRFLSQFCSELEGSFRYFAVDTFSGFDSQSVELEVRMKGSRFAWDNYSYLNYPLYEERRRELGYGNLEFVRHDAYHDRLKDLSFSVVILDVDLELSTRQYLEFFHPRMRPGGVILIDDAAPDTKYDGALRAYSDFCSAKGLAPKFIFPKTAVIQC